ncbi:hypothetical protein AX16_002625 [Volvariella volvacea WC 439]|nr:hypothetical protein AX16_002625 [Volvariella volvacea WC 439]
MWGNNQYQSSGPPSFPTPGGYGGGAPGFPTPNPYNHPGGPGGYAPPQGPPPGYPPPHGAPSYGQPPSGYHPPYGPPPGAPPGALRPGPPPGPPPPGAHQYGAPRPSGGPPPQHPQSRGFPGQSFRQQYRDFRSGYSADRAHPVPTQPQHYGPHFMNENNQDTQLSFQYSQCTGKKKALCIGINYFGQDGELRGCINDANNIKNFLIRHFGYREGDIVMLTDDAGDPRQHPTRDNIIRGMQWLVRNAAPDDSLFFHYSGHGGQTKDHDGDEADGYDEVIYPVDHRENGHIVDDHMHDIMVKSLPPGCRLTAIFDSCHSGSALGMSQSNGTNHLLTLTTGSRPSLHLLHRR